MYAPLNPNKPGEFSKQFIPGGAQSSSNLKSAVSAIPSHTKQQKTFLGTLGTQDYTSIGSKTSLGPSMDPTGPLTWTLWFLRKISGFLRKFRDFWFLIFSSPSNHVGPLNWSLPNSTKAQGTILDLLGPKNGPQKGPCKANFWGPLIKKGPAGSLHGPNWSTFLDRSQDNGQTWIYRLVWGPTDVRFRSNREFPTEDDDCAPPRDN